MRHRSFIWHAVNAWLLWRAHRRLRKAVPGLVALDTERSRLARQHRSGARAIDIERQRLVTERLRAEVMGRV